MANIDLSQFHEVFFEESFEGLETIETGLLNLDTSAPDSEIINNMFRAAHSIKGGAGTFGFNEVSGFTHVVESILDDVRGGTMDLSDGLVQLLLESVDFMKRMLVEAKSGKSLPEAEIEAFKARLESPEAAAPASETASVAGESKPAPEAASETSSDGWKIAFEPKPELFLSGHDPYRLFRELTTLGDVEVSADGENLPDFQQFDAEQCYLSWEVRLYSSDSQPIDRDQIEAVFEWIDDEADVTLTPIESSDRPATPAPAADEIDHPELVDAAQPAASSYAIPEVTSIRVNIDRVDHLVNLVGELVITQSMLSRFKDGFQRGDDMTELMRGLEQLEENTRELQDHTMRIRMLPIDSVFQRLPRLVRDVSRNLGKEVELGISGNNTEVDKTVLEKITDPLTHLVRNSLDHGIESAPLRIAAGKPAKGKVDVNAYHEGGSIIIEVSDDGAGLNREKILAKAVERGIIEADAEVSDAQIDNLIFAPGFSTADHISDVSGRGVGMDVVKNNIEQLNGHIQVSSETGKGSRFSIRLPLTLSIIEGQLVRVGSDVFIIPLLSIIESTRINADLYGAVAGDAEMYRVPDGYIRIVRLDDVYNIRADYTDVSNAIMVVVNGREQFGILVDEVLGQQQVVVKSLETNFKLIPTVSGATILGDGTVAMILDIASLFRESFPQQVA